MNVEQNLSILFYRKTKKANQHGNYFDTGEHPVKVIQMKIK